MTAGNIDSEVLDLISHGLVTEEQVREAMARQRKERPPIGRLAVEEKMLTAPQVMEILRIQKGRSFRFGEVAKRKRWLTEEQIVRLLGMQQRRTRPLLTIMIELGLVTHADVARVRGG